MLEEKPEPISFKIQPFACKQRVLDGNHESPSGRQLSRHKAQDTEGGLNKLKGMDAVDQLKSPIKLFCR